MTKAERTANMIGVVVPFLGLIAAVVLLWNKWVDWIDLGIMVVHVPALRAGRDRGLPPAAHAPGVPDLQAGRVRLGDRRLDGPAGRRARLGRRPPQAPRPHRPGGRPALPARRPRRGPRAASGTRTPAGCSRPTARRTGRSTPASSTRTAACAGSTSSSRSWRSTACSSRPRSASSCTASRSRARSAASSGAASCARSSSHHITWSINSVCHYFGNRRFEIEDLSTNVFWLALPSLGEAWHHNHHAFPRSAQHGLRWWEIDVSALVISGMEKVGLAWNVVRISPERQAAKEAERKEPVAV